MRWPLVLSALALIACSEESNQTPAQPPEGPECVGDKCDGAEGAIDDFIVSLEIHDFEAADGMEQSFSLIAHVADAYYGDPEDGDELQLELFDVGSPDYRVKSKLVYYEDGIGAFASPSIDTSTLLPWMNLGVRVVGALGDKKVDQTLTITPEMIDDAIMTAPLLSKIEVNQYTSSEGEQESFAIIAEVGDAYYGIPHDGHTLKLTLEDAAHPGFQVEGTLTYYEDGVGAYMTEVIDTSYLLPWQALKVHVTGDLGDILVDQEFTLTAEDIHGPSVIEPIGALSLSQYDRGEGQERFMLIAEVGEAHYGLPSDGDTLAVTLAVAPQDGGDLNAELPSMEATLTYHEDGIGAFTTGLIDTTALLPWEELEVTITGTLAGQTVEQTLYLLPPDGPFARLWVHEHISNEGMMEQLIIRAEENFNFDGDIPDALTLTLSDAAHPGFEVTTTLSYFEDGLNAYYTTDYVDTSDLLPWVALKAQITGEGVDQTFLIRGEDLPYIEPLGDLQVLEHILGDSTQELISLAVEAQGDDYDLPMNGDTLDITFTVAPQDGGDLNAELPSVHATLTYHEDGIGAFTTGEIDISALLPWVSLDVRVTGNLDGYTVQQDFVLDRDDLD